MNSKLTLEYQFSRDDDDFGWLAAAVETPKFKARNGMWVQWQDIGDFAARLSTYPLQADSPVTGEWGFSEAGKYTAITKIIIAPHGSTGTVFANVSLADYDQPEVCCMTLFETDYPAPDRFREEIERMMSRRTGEAVLAGSTKEN